MRLDVDNYACALPSPLRLVFENFSLKKKYLKFLFLVFVIHFLPNYVVFGIKTHSQIRVLQQEAECQGFPPHSVSYTIITF